MKKQDSVALINAKKEEKRINRLFYDILGENGAPELVEALDRKVFGTRSLVTRLQDGKVDVAATMVKNGAYELLSYIKQRIELGAKGK